MARESPEIRLVRETLEEVLHPTTASTVLFDALQEHGGVPSTPESMRELLHGPLARRVTELLGQDAASSVMDQLATMIGRIAPQSRRVSRHEERTRHVELRTETMPVLVLSGSSAFSEKLTAALGPQVMTAVLATDGPMLRRRLDQIAPAFVLVDASSFPAIEPRELVELLGTISTDVVKGVWGADLPYGMSVLACAQEARTELTPFDRREGIAPLLDMIRSRRA